jgi:hypothetical protein
MGIAAAGANMVYLTQKQNVMVAPQQASVAPPMGMVIATPVAAQIDLQRNSLIGTEANGYQLLRTLIDDPQTQGVRPRRWQQSYPMGRDTILT